MIDICIIPPLNHMDYALKGDRLFALAHYVLQDENYCEFFRQNRNKYIIMDNGAAEGQNLTLGELLLAIDKIKPDEVIVKDVLLNKDATIRASISSARAIKERYPHIKLMMVPQGRNVVEWLGCYYTFLEEPLCDVIGISKISVPECFKNISISPEISDCRNVCLQVLAYLGLLGKPLHLLGMGNPNEYREYSDEPYKSYIRSTDSAYTMVAAFNGQDFVEVQQFTRYPTKEEYFSAVLDHKQSELAAKNIEYLKEITTYTP